MTEELQGIPSAVTRQLAPRAEPPVSRTSPAQRTAPSQATTSQTSTAAQTGEASIAVEELNEELAARDISLRFSVDEATEQIVVRVTDENTGDVIRQIPPDERLRIAAHLRELLGVLYNQTV